MSRKNLILLDNTLKIDTMIKETLPSQGLNVNLGLPNTSQMFLPLSKQNSWALEQRILLLVSRSPTSQFCTRTQSAT